MQKIWSKSYYLFKPLPESSIYIFILKVILFLHINLKSPDNRILVITHNNVDEINLRCVIP